MYQRTTTHAQRHRGYLRTLLWLGLICILILNGLAWVQARAMTHFAADGQPLDRFASAPLTEKLWALATGVKIPRPTNQHTPREHYLPFEVRQIPLPANERLEAWLVPHPQPHGIAIMFPGYAGVKEGLLTPAAHLYRLGYSSLLVDFRGAGGSSGSDSTIGMREAEDVAAAFAYVQQHWPRQPIILYGVSMGGAAIFRAVALANVRPAANHRGGRVRPAGDHGAAPLRCGTSAVLPRGAAADLLGQRPDRLQRLHPQPG